MGIPFEAIASDIGEDIAERSAIKKNQKSQKIGLDFYFIRGSKIPA